MKAITIIQAAILFAVIAFAASCSSGRDYSSSVPQKTPATVSASFFSLIVQPGKGIHECPDGRFFYRDPHGYIYWQGYKKRFYLDRAYVNGVNYDEKEYAEWMKFHNK